VPRGVCYDQGRLQRAKANSPDVAAQLAEHAADDPLTSCELEVLQLIGAGKANNLIASDLAITEETVKGHVKNILSKLGASDRTPAVTIALKRGIIELGPLKTGGSAPRIEAVPHPGLHPCFERGLPCNVSFPCSRMVCRALDSCSRVSCVAVSLSPPR